MESTVLQVLAALLVIQWLGLCCANSLSGGLYMQPLDLNAARSVVLSDWSTALAFSGLVLFPLLSHKYVAQVHSAYCCECNCGHLKNATTYSCLGSLHSCLKPAIIFLNSYFCEVCMVLAEHRLLQHVLFHPPACLFCRL